MAMMMLLCGQSSCAHCTDFSITSGMSILSLPEWASTSTRSVVIRWRRTVTFLVTMAASKEELNASRDDEQNTVDS